MNQDNLPDYIDPANMTSVEAAALFLSDGRTKDPELANIYAANEENELNMDALTRAALRRAMGFDYRIKIRPNKIHVSSKQSPYVSTHVRLKPGDLDAERYMLTNQDVIDRLVEACLRLKAKHDKAVENE